MLFIKIEKDSKKSLSNQIYEGLKNAILSGILESNEKLPSSRELAKSLMVSRNTVIEAYEQLNAEGYVISQNGSGTYVEKNLFMSQFRAQKTVEAINTKNDNKKKIVSFRTGIPDLKQLPLKQWTNAYQKATHDMSSEDFDYQDAMGDFCLRKELSKYLNRARGTVSSPENIMITNGAAQSFYLLCKLVQKDEYVVVENPCSRDLLHTIKSNVKNIKPISVEQHGIQTMTLPQKPPKLIFTTPSHQFPTGEILSAKRRVALVNYTQKKNCYIVEDDYDSEFRFDGNPICSMQSLDPSHVIYVGTVSKTLIPSLRLGYMILPENLCQKIREYKYVIDICSPVIEQRAFSLFLQEGLYERHLRKMRKEYLAKRNCLIAYLQENFGNTVSISGAEIGLHLVANFSKTSFSERLIRKINNTGIEITALSSYALTLQEKEKYKHALLFGYGNTDLEQIPKGIRLLAEIIIG